MSYRTMVGNVSASDLHFGLSLMSHLGQGNVSVSPTSVRTALAMLYEGARGETAAQIAETAILPVEAAKRHATFGELAAVLNAANVPYTVRFANALWAANEHPLNPDFKRVLTDHYKAEARQADFKGNAGGESAAITEWVRQKTEGKIGGLFPAGSINQLTALVLANALYFKAPWADKFNPKFTQQQDFTLPTGEKVKTDMMRKGKADYDSTDQLPSFPYGEFSMSIHGKASGNIQAVMLQYQGHQLATIIMLPPKGSDARSLEALLSNNEVDLLTVSRRLMPEKFARLEIPKHELKGSYDLIGPLTAMGIDRVFALATAELSGIGPGPLVVNSGRHETCFKTDEEGSEGAAATGFGVLRGINIPKELVADRPFLEAVIHTETGAVLFLNRIEDPR